MRSISRVLGWSCPGRFTFRPTNWTSAIRKFRAIATSSSTAL